MEHGITHVIGFFWFFFNFEPPQLSQFVMNFNKTNVIIIREVSTIVFICFRVQFDRKQNFDFVDFLWFFRFSFESNRILGYSNTVRNLIFICYLIIRCISLLVLSIKSVLLSVHLWYYCFLIEAYFFTFFARFVESNSYDTGQWSFNYRIL